MLGAYAWKSGIYAIYPETRLLSAKTRAFVEFLAARFGREPPWQTAPDFGARRWYETGNRYIALRPIGRYSHAIAAAPRLP